MGLVDRQRVGAPGTCRNFNPGVKVVFAGTRQVYGRPDSLPVNESHLVRPTDVNGINKAAGEYYHLVYNNVFGVRAVDVCEPQGAGPHTEDIVVHKVIYSPAALLMPLTSVGRTRWDSLTGSESGRPYTCRVPANTTLTPGLKLRQGLEDRELTAAVDFEIANGSQHAVDVADLPGQIEDHGSAGDEVVHRAFAGGCLQRSRGRDWPPRRC